jgi:ribosomal protein S18 acetylase RimI-like enzyme
MDHAKKSGATEVFLDVRADNRAARALYESMGFSEISRRPGYYQPDGVDAVVMSTRVSA